MRRPLWFGWAVICGVVFIWGCTDQETASKEPSAAQQSPFKRIPGGDEDPGDNGPDDSTELSGVPGDMGKVAFTHFTHASNSKKGYGIPCRECHHTTPRGEDPSQGCTDEGCHYPSEKTYDPAHAGPDDNMLLIGDDPAAVAPVAFNHFTHASSSGYKTACTQCHHTGDLIGCSECHEKIATKADDGKVIPKTKRAFHLKCNGCHQAIKKTDPDSIAPVKCEDCHGGRTPARLPGSLTLERAYHLSCVGCHNRVKMAGTGTPPVDCGDCHKQGSPKMPDPEPKKEEAAEKPAPQEQPAPSAPTAQAVDAGATEPAKDEEQSKGPEKILIDHAKKAKSGTPFPHSAHQELGEPCAKCHHQGLDDPSCRNCHSETADAKKIYHKICIACHKENGISAGCADCHPKGE